MYNQEIMNRFLDPKFIGQIKGANAVGVAQDPKTNEMVKFYFSVAEDAVVNEAKFKAFGCPVVIALADATAEMIAGMTIEELEEVSESKIVKLLKEIPEERIYAVFLIIDALNNTIDDYYKKLRRLENKMRKQGLLVDDIEAKEEDFDDYDLYDEE